MSIDAPSWLVDWLEGVSLWDAILWALAVVAVVVFIQRKGWRWVTSFARAILATAEVIDNVRELPKFIERTDATLAAQDLKIAEIHHETHTNNGSSIKDGVQRVEEGVAGLYDRTDHLEHRIGEVDLKLLALADADADLRADFENTHPKEPE